MFRYLTGQGICWEGEGVTSVTPPAPPPAEHPVSAPWAAAQGTWMLGEGANAKPWFETIPEEPVRELMRAKQYATPNEVAMAYHNLNKLQNGANDVVNVPGANATPDDWNKFYTKLGRPESSDKYELKFAEGAKTDDNMIKFGKDLAFELGLPPQRAQMMADKWQEFVGKQNEGAVAAQQAQNTADMSALETKWGTDLNVNKAAGLRAMQALGLSPELVGKVESGIGTAAIVELLATIGRKSDEGGFTTGSKGDPNDPASMSKQEAEAKIAALSGDMEFQKKYMDKNHPENKMAVERMLALMQRTSAA